MLRQVNGRIVRRGRGPRGRRWWLDAGFGKAGVGAAPALDGARCELRWAAPGPHPADQPLLNERLNSRAMARRRCSFCYCSEVGWLVADADGTRGAAGITIGYAGAAAGGGGAPLSAPAADGSPPRRVALNRSRRSRWQSDRGRRASACGALFARDRANPRRRLPSSGQLDSALAYSSPARPTPRRTRRRETRARRDARPAAERLAPPAHRLRRAARRRRLAPAIEQRARQLAGYRAPPRSSASAT